MAKANGSKPKEKAAECLYEIQKWCKTVLGDGAEKLGRPGDEKRALETIFDLTKKEIGDVVPYEEKAV